jgi:hypothetical protein
MNIYLKVFGLILILWGAPIYAEGLYDGIWQTSESGFSTVNQNGNMIIVIGLDTEDGRWGASSGILEGNQSIISTIISGGAQIISRVEFTSLTTATATLISCIPDPGFVCLAPNGFTFVINKVF